MKIKNTKFGEYERVTDTHIYFWKVLCQKNWLGENLLGKAITEVSKIIRG